MQVEDFFSHWRIREHPFCAEEARDDPVFLRLMESGPSHPDFEKVYGDPTRPSASVVFGEKGAGKTALRLLLQRRFAQDAEDENRRVWVVRYDDLNAMLDRFASVKRRRGDDRVLDRLRLADHQDAIFSQAVTALVDGLLSKEKILPTQVVKTSRKMSRSLRIDLATMAAL